MDSTEGFLKLHIRPFVLCVLHLIQYIYGVINPRHACTARVTVVGLSVCLSVCLCVDAYSGTTGYGVANERYQRLHNYPNLKNY